MSDRDLTYLRSLPSLLKKLDALQERLIYNFNNVLGRAAGDETARHQTATTEFQLQVETGNIIRSAEELQVVIRQLQEMWLFGELDTVGESQVQARTDERAREVAGLLQKLVERQGDEEGSGGEGMEVNGQSS